MSSCDSEKAPDVRKPLGEKSAFLTARNTVIGALITTVVALAFNPISLVVGYRLSKALSKPKIRIEFVKPIVGYKNVVLEEDIVTDIASNREAFDKIKARWFMSSTGPDFSMIRMLLKWDQMLKNTELSYDFLEIAVAHESDLLSEYGAKIKVMQDNLEALSLQDVFDVSVLRKVSGFDLQRVEEAGKSGDPNAALVVIEKWKAGLTQERDALARIFTSFRELLQAEKERSGEISFEVGLLNLGDTDGVVYPEGEMNTGGRSFQIADERDRYVVIEPHSFSKCVFKIKKEEVAGKDLDYLRSLITKFIPEPYYLAIKTTNGDRSIRGVLPVN
ncbi:MAG: hypothetical protein JW741_10100 [Sedimentisphaerales bacterium]|nr:hypothetical protein [Sedimentisphaerales bacterium]